MYHFENSQFLMKMTTITYTYRFSSLIHAKPDVSGIPGILFSRNYSNNF